MHSLNRAEGDLAGVAVERPEGAAGRWMRNGGMLLLGFSLLELFIHLLVGEGYGYFRDEFYYLACSDHLAWGYVDQPPLSILLLRVSRMLLGDSVTAIRVLPALAGAATVYTVGWMARELGGRRWAQALAMTAVLVAPQYLGTAGYYSMNGFDVLIWALAGALMISIIKEDRPCLWVWLGILLGLGLMNKISVLWLGFGLFTALLLTRERRSMLTRWPWIAGAIAFLIFAPHIIWQALNDWPTLEFIQNASGQKMRSIAPVDFLIEQILIMNPMTLPVWIAGLVFVFAAPGGRRYRALGIIYLAVLLLLVLNRTSRAGYLAPAYTMLFAAGGVGLELLVDRWGWKWMKPAFLAGLCLGGLALAPLTLPILPVESYVRYAAALGIAPFTDERKEVAELPQHYADMHGWEELVAKVAEVHATLSAEEQAVATVFVHNYGEAGAIDLLGRELGLPRAISGHNNYWLWGPRGYSGEVMIIVGGPRDDHQEVFDEVRLAGTTDCDYCMPYEDNQPIFIAKGLKVSLEAIWPELKHYN